MLRFAVVFWMPAFAGMTAETGAHMRHAGESRIQGASQNASFQPQRVYWLRSLSD